MNIQFNKAFLQDLWQLLKPYWGSEEKASAFTLLMLNLICSIGTIYGSIGYNRFHNLFFTALQNFDKVAIISALLYFLKIVLLYVLSLSLGVYFKGLLCIRWQRWLTQSYLKKWQDNHNHFSLQESSNKIDNPDQRISEDLKQFPELTVSLFFKFFHSLLFIISFGYILWNLSSDMMTASRLLIPGWLCWIAFSYAMLGTWAMSWIGKSLASLDYQQQRYNADFRFFLVKFRSEKIELGHFNKLFSKIFKNFITINTIKTRLELFKNAHSFFAYVVGMVVSIPFYLAKKVQLGIVMQTSSAFNSVVSGLSLFIESFNDLAQWRSVTQRLTEFHKIIGELNTETENSFPKTEPAVSV